MWFFSLYSVACSDLYARLCRDEGALGGGKCLSCAWWSTSVFVAAGERGGQTNSLLQVIWMDGGAHGRANR